MLYAQIRDNKIVRTGPAPTMPGYEEGEWWDFSDPDVVADYLTTYGWQRVDETPRPADTADTYQQPVVQLVGGVPTVTWVAVNKAPQTVEGETRAAATQALVDQLLAGTAQIVTARNAATADISTAETLRTDALSVKAAANTQKTQVDAFAPGTTYKQSDLTAIRSALSQILARQALIIDTIASLAAWRKAVDENAVTTDNALLWLAKHTTGDVLANETFA